MVDATARARRQLARRAWLRRRLPAAIVTTAVPLGAIGATAWVWPRATAPASSVRIPPRAGSGLSQLAAEADALRSLNAAVSSSEAQIAALPHASEGSGTIALPPLPSLAPASSFSLPPPSHATTGASGVP